MHRDRGLLCTHNCQGSATRCACVLARRRKCFAQRMLSTSPWKRGTLARSPACMCAAACVGIRRGQGALAHTQLPRGQPQAVCVCLRGAVYVPLSDCFQPASGSMGRWPGCQHVGAPPPTLGLGAPVHTQLPRASYKLYVCAGATQHMFSVATVFNQPVAAWDVGKASTMGVRRRLRRD